MIYILPLLCAVSSCRTGNNVDVDPVSRAPTDAFVHGSIEEINQQVLDNERQAKSLNWESKWLSLRARVVEAEKYACECRDSELKLAAQMAGFGAMDKKFSQGGFISDEQRNHWNTELRMKKDLRIGANARANLLRRDLEDLRKKILKEGISVPEGSAFDESN